MRQERSFGGSRFDRMAYWPCQNPRATVLLIHGLTEYAGRYENMAACLNAQSIELAAFDIPGHGSALLTVEGAPRPGYCGGEGSWQLAVDMIDRAVFSLHSRAPGRPLILVGFSLGSFLARAWLLQHPAGPIDRLVLVGTGQQPVWLLKAIRGIVRGECKRHGAWNSTPLIQNLAFGSYNRQIKNARSPYAWLLADPEAQQAYEADAQICKAISGGLFRELLSCMIYTAQELPRPYPFPVSFLSGEEDPVGDRKKGVRRAAKKFPGASVEFFPGRHDILHDAGWEQAAARIVSFIE